MGAANLPRRLLAVKFLYVAIVPTNACQHIKFELSSSVSFGDMRGSQIKKNGAPDFPRYFLSDKFLYSALVRVLVRLNAYKCATFQLPSSISYGDMEGVPK